MELTKEAKVKLMEAVGKGFKAAKDKPSELLKKFQQSYKNLTPQEQDTLVVGLTSLGFGGLVGYGLGKKAEVVYIKLASERWSQAGGSLVGGAGGALTGAAISEKLLANAKTAPKSLKSALTVAAAIAGLYPGEVIGRHVGEGVDEIFNMGKYKDRGKYKKNK